MEEVPRGIIRREANRHLTEKSIPGVVITSMGVNNRKRALNVSYVKAETVDTLKAALDNEFSKLIVEYDLSSNDLTSAFIIISTPELLEKLST